MTEKPTELTQGVWMAITKLSEVPQYLDDAQEILLYHKRDGLAYEVAQVRSELATLTSRLATIRMKLEK